MSVDCFCDYDPPSVYRRQIVTARKPHKCYECSGEIGPGEQYEYVFGIWEGCADVFKTCERCYDIRQWVKNNVPCFCWAHGNMLDDAECAIDDAFWRAPLETVGLRFGFLRRKVEASRHRKAP